MWTRLLETQDEALSLSAPKQATEASPCMPRADGPRTTVQELETNLNKMQEAPGPPQPSEGFVWSEKRKTEKRNRSRAKCTEGEKDKRKGKSPEVRESCEWHFGNKAPPLCPLFPLINHPLGLVRSALPPVPRARRGITAHRGLGTESPRPETCAFCACEPRTPSPQAEPEAPIRQLSRITQPFPAPNKG